MDIECRIYLVRSLSTCLSIDLTLNPAGISGSLKPPPPGFIGSTASICCDGCGSAAAATSLGFGFTIREVFGWREWQGRGRDLRWLTSRGFSVLGRINTSCLSIFCSFSSLCALSFSVFLRYCSAVLACHCVPFDLTLLHYCCNSLEDEICIHLQ